MKIVVVPGEGGSLKEKVAAKARQCREWFVRNKEVVIVLAPVAVGGAMTLIKVVSRHASLRKEESLKNLFCYDRSLGHYWALRRALSNQEWLAIEARRKAGERLSDILASLKVLK
jgi:hypothetical protein